MQKRSLLYDREGAPACAQVDQLIKLQRLEKEAQVSREAKQPILSHTEINLNSRYDNGGNYYWNNLRGKYCYHDVDDRVLHYN